MALAGKADDLKVVVVSRGPDEGRGSGEGPGHRLLQVAVLRGHLGLLVAEGVAPGDREGSDAGNGSQSQSTNQVSGKDVVLPGDVRAGVASRLECVVREDDRFPPSCGPERLAKRGDDVLLALLGAGGGRPDRLLVLVKPPLGVEGEEPDGLSHVEDDRARTTPRRSEGDRRPAMRVHEVVLPPDRVPAVPRPGGPVVVSRHEDGPPRGPRGGELRLEARLHLRAVRGAGGGSPAG